MTDASDQIEQEITRLEREWIEAVRRQDASALAHIIADDCLLFSTFVGWRGRYLEDLYVNPEVRGKGIGRDMLVYLAGFCER